MGSRIISSAVLMIETLREKLNHRYKTIKIKMDQKKRKSFESQQQGVTSMITSHMTQNVQNIKKKRIIMTKIKKKIKKFSS